jgi:hypothetical protein
LFFVENCIILISSILSSFLLIDGISLMGSWLPVTQQQRWRRPEKVQQEVEDYPVQVQLGMI